MPVLILTVHNDFALRYRRSEAYSSLEISRFGAIPKSTFSKPKYSGTNQTKRVRSGASHDDFRIRRSQIRHSHRPGDDIPRRDYPLTKCQPTMPSSFWEASAWLGGLVHNHQNRKQVGGRYAVLPAKMSWWLGRESNPRHRDFQSPALPTELPSRCAARIAACSLYQTFASASRTFFQNRPTATAVAAAASPCRGRRLGAARPLVAVRALEPQYSTENPRSPAKTGMSSFSSM